MTDSPREPAEVWTTLSYEILHATLSLMHLLEGMEHVRQRVTPKYDWYPEPSRQWAVCPPELPYVDPLLVEVGPPVDLNDVWGREGASEQLAFKGWVMDVYNRIWDRNLRVELQESLQGDDVIPPENDVLGDLRLIRHDLLHHRGVASKENCGKCVILKWFRPDEPMVLTMGHVIDFLNHMGMLNLSASHKPDGAAIKWSVFPELRHVFEQRPTPKIVSLRTDVIDNDEDGTSIHGVFIAFANGVWCNTPLVHPADGTPMQDRIAYVNRTHVDENGDVALPNGTTLTRHDRYMTGIAAMFGDFRDEAQLPLPGPAIRFRR